MSVKQFMYPETAQLFAEKKYSYEDLRALMFDTVQDNLDGVDANAAEGKIRQFMMELFELTPETVNNKKIYRRAVKKHMEQFFEVIEDIIDDPLVQGWNNDPFFMEFVETRSINDGDVNEFYTKNEVRLSVHRVSGHNHDITVQNLGKGTSFSVKTNTYGIAVGMDLRIYLLGRRSFSELIDAIRKAFDQKIKGLIYEEVASIGAKLPVSSMFNKVVPTTSAGKDTFDTLLEDVSIANDNAEVFILATRSGSKQISKFNDVDWVPNTAKEELYKTGRLGYYEGTPIIEIPQQMIRSGSTLEKLVANDQVLVMPKGENKFIKFVDQGDATITQVMEAGARVDDTLSYQLERTFGVNAVVGKYFGNVKLTAGS